MNTFGLGEVFGVELEYMIVDRNSLDVRPIAVELLGPDGEVDRGPVTWCNELAAHIIELKLTHPSPSLAGLSALFQSEVAEINRRLAAFDAMILPTAMHPWMDPYREMVLWPHESGPIYAAFDRIFDCRGHGWANLQSVHMNLPFRGDEEFARLHAAIRMVLPLIPALSASSPFKEGQATGLLDERLSVFKSNAARIPSVTGHVVPEPVFTESDYRKIILHPMYRDIAPLDPEGILQEEWLNARGAIARFERGAIEIRVTDVQECPASDIAILMMVWRFIERYLGQTDRIGSVDTVMLSALLEDVVRVGGKASVRHIPECGAGPSVMDIWIGLLSDGGPLADPAADSAIRVILEEGNLAERILKRSSPLIQTYSELARCAALGAVFRAG